MKKIIVSLFVVLIIAISIVYSADSNFLTTIVSPEAYSTSISTTILFNLTANWTGSSIITNNQVNCSLWTKTSTGAAYNLNVSNVPLTNMSINSTNMAFINKSFTFTDKTRVWSYWSCLNNNINVGNTSVRIVDIDTSYNTLSLGNNQVVNFSVTTGDISAAGVISSIGLKVNNSVGISGNYTGAEACWKKFLGGILVATNCTSV